MVEGSCASQSEHASLYLQSTELASLGGGVNTKDSFTSRTKMVLSSLQTNFEAAAEQGSVKKRRLSSGSPHRPGLEVAHCCCRIIIRFTQYCCQHTLHNCQVAPATCHSTSCEALHYLSAEDAIIWWCVYVWDSPAHSCADTMCRSV